VRREFQSLGSHQPSSKVIELIRRLEHVNPSRPVGDLIDDLGGSRSRMWRTATAALGMSPKRFLMLRRFEVGMRLLSSGVPLAAAAVRAGYVDQAHFHREVKRWAGHTPGELLRRVDATYVQDGSPDQDR
jgi:AraC-like DNA-binding protein